MRPFLAPSITAHAVFWLLLPYGWWSYELSSRTTLTFILLWAAGFWGLPYLVWFGHALFLPYVAVLDIALVLCVFKQDVTLR